MHETWAHAYIPWWTFSPFLPRRFTHISNHTSADMHSPRAIFVAALLSFFGLGSALQVRSVDYYDPTANGGSMLDDAGDGYGEPLNVPF